MEYLVAHITSAGCVTRVYLLVGTASEDSQCGPLLRHGQLTLYFIQICNAFFDFKVATFTLEQKVNITTGIGWASGVCSGNTPAVGDFPGLCLQDSPLGVRMADFVTAFPAGINAAST